MLRDLSKFSPVASLASNTGFIARVEIVVITALV
jgi:hypothetical protein